MPIGEMNREIGHLRGSVSGLERWTMHALAAQRKEYMGHIMLLHRRSNGGHKGIPWAQIAAMASTAIAFLIGLIKPELAASLMRALTH